MAANNGNKDAKEFITSRLTQNQLQQLGFSDNGLHSLSGECGEKSSPWSVGENGVSRLCLLNARITVTG